MKSEQNNRFNLTRLLSRFVLTRYARLRTNRANHGSQVKRMFYGRASRAQLIFSVIAPSWRDFSLITLIMSTCKFEMKNQLRNMVGIVINSLLIQSTVILGFMNGINANL